MPNPRHKAHWIAAGYLAGIIDGEGNVDYSERYCFRRIRIYNNEASIISTTMRHCDTLGLTYSLSQDHRPGDQGKTFMLMLAKRANLETVAKYVPLGSTTKSERLAYMLSTYQR